MKENPSIFFDQSLPILAEKISNQFGVAFLEEGLVVRDSSGRLRFLSAQSSLSYESRAQVEATLIEALGGYARTEGVMSFSDEPGIQPLLKDPAAFHIQEGSFNLRLLDRRIVGPGWVDPPNDAAAWPPRIVFASIKGGVGRSTALAVAASDLSRRNKNVLVIDLDLEAPGLGDMLLDEERMPRFGTIDYLVENGLGGIPDQSLVDFIGTSELTTVGGGRVDIVPAIGHSAVGHPYNTLPKLARAMIEDISSSGETTSLTVQIAEMIQRFTQVDSYDVVLIDSRAGLSELAAPTMLGLGAKVLLFGTAQRQTVQGYAALFAGLKLLAQRDRVAGRSAEWRLQFKAVHSKATLDESAAARYRDDLYDLFADNLYDADDNQPPNPDAVTFDIDDEDGPHWPLVIPFTQNFVDFDPVQAPSHLTGAFYEQAFRPFLNGIDLIIGSCETARHELGSE